MIKMSWYTLTPFTLPVSQSLPPFIGNYIFDISDASFKEWLAHFHHDADYIEGK